MTIVKKQIWMFSDLETANGFVIVAGTKLMDRREKRISETREDSVTRPDSCED